MTTQESVVTPPRYAQGRTWSDYLEYIGSKENIARPSGGSGERQDNTERFRRNYGGFQLTQEEIARLRALPKMKLLVIGEDWCPDVFRGIPTLARLAEAADWELRIFQRDQNKDIMAEFLNHKDGEKYESIPVAIIYTADHQYVGHWIERPRVANEYMEETRRRFTRKPGESDDDMRARQRQEYRDLQTSDEWDRWRHATVDEIATLIENAK